MLSADCEGFEESIERLESQKWLKRIEIQQSRTRGPESRTRRDIFLVKIFDVLPTSDIFPG